MAALSGAQVAQVVYQAGFRGQDLTNMVAIARRESGWQATAHRSDQPKHKLSGDLGLFQINYVNWPVVSRALGLSSKSQLFDPVISARAAKVLFDAGGYGPWAAGPGGWQKDGNALYGTNIGQAQNAVSEAQSRGMLGQAYGGNAEGGYSDGGASNSGGAANPYGNPTTGNEYEGGPITLPPDAQVVSVDGNLKALFSVGGLHIAYDIADPSAYELPGTSRSMSAQQFNELDSVDAGDAAELATVAVSFNSFGEMWESIIGQVMGYNNPARNDPGVLRVLAEFAGRPDMTPVELQNRLQATEWFQARTASELEWNSLSEAERQQRETETASRMADTFFQFTGLRPDPNDPTIRNYLTDVASGKMGYGQFTEIVKGFADDDPESPWARQQRDAAEARKQRPVDIENTSQRVREAVERWGLQWSPQTIQKWAKGIVENEKSDEDLILTLRNEAQVIYPWKDPETETATAAAPWLETYRRTMEQSATVNSTDVQRALTQGQTPFEFEQELKRSDKWLSTKNGQNTMHGTISELGRRMGFV